LKSIKRAGAIKNTAEVSACSYLKPDGVDKNPDLKTMELLQCCLQKRPVKREPARVAAIIG
jgi:hypothetical protein